jgi:hypothetical protein
MLFNNQLIGNLDSNAKLSEPIGAYRSGFIAGEFTTQQVLFSDYPLSESIPASTMALTFHDYLLKKIGNLLATRIQFSIDGINLYLKPQNNPQHNY